MREVVSQGMSEHVIERLSVRGHPRCRSPLGASCDVAPGQPSNRPITRPPSYTLTLTPLKRAQLPPCCPLHPPSPRWRCVTNFSVTPPSRVRSIRLPKDLWDWLEQEAQGYRPDIRSTNAL